MTFTMMRCRPRTRRLESCGKEAFGRERNTRVIRGRTDNNAECGANAAVQAEIEERDWFPRLAWGSRIESTRECASAWRDGKGRLADGDPDSI